MDYVRPKKFRGKFIVTTRTGKTVTTGNAIEAVESTSQEGRDRTLWQWIEERDYAGDISGRYIARN